ncbi:MAG: NADH-quinone oxidoreductase subunit NuoK [Holophagaceae bacterium]|jgi:NADH-quinone oxidoreductase subunit K
MISMPSFLQALWTGGLQGYLLVGFLLFVIGLMTVLLRRSFLLQFMGIELMLNAINIILLAFGKWQGGAPTASIFYLFIIGVAACEAAIGLALIVELYRLKNTTDADQHSTLRH